MNQYNHISYSIYRCKYLPNLQTSGFLNTLLSGWDKLINQYQSVSVSVDLMPRDKKNAINMIY